MLSETGNRAEMLFRQIELERIISYISPDKFDAAFQPAQYDLTGLNAKYRELSRLDKRMGAIINYNRYKTNALEDIIVEKELLEHYLDRFDHYYRLAFKSDFRFVNFVEGLSTPAYSNAFLSAAHRTINLRQKISPAISRYWGRQLALGLTGRGAEFESSANQLRALTYYRSAYEFSRLMHIHDCQQTAYTLAGRMIDSISASYIEISRKSALTDNPAMAAQYFRDAKDLFADREFKSFEPLSAKEYENWLFTNFENQVVKYLGLKNYNKALAYLNEIQLHCTSDPSFPFPEEFADWMRTARTGIYLELLNRAQELVLKDELQDAEDVFSRAVEMRLRAGYRIDKDARESKLESGFMQVHYNELVEEGMRYLNKEEFSSALYYLNKAVFLESFGITRHDTGLYNYRQAAARKVMLAFLGGEYRE
jgi:hypothetical protein